MSFTAPWDTYPRVPHVQDAVTSPPRPPAHVQASCTQLPAPLLGVSRPTGTLRPSLTLVFLSECTPASPPCPGPGASGTAFQLCRTRPRWLHCAVSSAPHHLPVQPASSPQNLPQAQGPGFESQLCKHKRFCPWGQPVPRQHVSLLTWPPPVPSPQCQFFPLLPYCTVAPVPPALDAASSQWPAGPSRPVPSLPRPRSLLLRHSVCVPARAWPLPCPLPRVPAA